MTASGRVTLAVADGVARLRLARPEARNAIDPTMVAALAETAERVADDTAVRAVLISAEGPAFSVGGDLRHFGARPGELAAMLDEMIPVYHHTLARLATLNVPVVCAVQGAIAGGGLGLAWIGDIVLAAEDAVFATGFAQLGLSGDGGSSWFLPRLVGLRVAQEMLIGGRVLSATEAREAGLVTRVVPCAELAAAAEAEAVRLASGPTVALAHMRRLLRESWSATLEQQLASESAAMQACSCTADAREGLVAFVERRSPRFTGKR